MMEKYPDLEAKRFAQVSPGDLFIYPFKGGNSFALKVIDPNEDGDKFIVPLGPKFPDDPQQPRMYDERSATTVSFGKDFIFEFSTEPDSWSTEEPDLKFFCIALVASDIFLRVNCDRSVDRYTKCWIKLADGSVSHNRLPGTAMYATKWALRIPNTNAPSGRILEYTETPL